METCYYLFRNVSFFLSVKYFMTRVYVNYADRLRKNMNTVKKKTDLLEKNVTNVHSTSK